MSESDALKICVSVRRTNKHTGICLRPSKHDYSPVVFGSRTLHNVIIFRAGGSAVYPKRDRIFKPAASLHNRFRSFHCSTRVKAPHKDS